MVEKYTHTHTQETKTGSKKGYSKKQKKKSGFFFSPLLTEILLNRS